MVPKNKSTKFPQYLATITVCLGAISTGTVLGWTGNISDTLLEGKYNDIPINETDFGWIGSIANLGSMFVCFPIGIICDKIGRKYASLLLTIPFIVGWLLIIFANSVVMMLVGRFVIGVAGGGFCIAAPLYASEVGQKQIRGALGSYFQLFLTFGILISYVLGYAVDTKIFTIIVAVIPVVFFVAFLFQPETPVFRMKQGREDEARAILKRLRGEKYNLDEEIADIKKVLEELKNNNVTLSDSLKKRSTRIAAIVSFSLMFFQQGGGIKAVIFYTSRIFEDSGSSVSPTQATMIIGAIQFAATFVSSNVVDRLGRRVLLLLSSFFMAVGLIILGVFFTLQGTLDKDTLDALGVMPIVGVAIFITVYSLGLGPISWMISSELYPTEIKSVASAAAGTFNWFVAFVVTKFYGDLRIAVGGDVTFYMFAGICVLAFIFNFFVVPETKGKSLEQIQKELNKQTLKEGIDNKVSIGIFLSGLAAGWTGNITDSLLAGEYKNITITVTDLEWITSLPTLAGLIFCIPVGVLCDKIGRKPTLLGLAACTTVGWFLIAFAKSLTLILVGRFVIGIGKGPATQLIPLYNVEIAENHVRAKFGSFTPLLLNSGVFLASILGYVTTVHVFTIICASISVLYFIVLLFQSETPTYKIMRNDYDNAKKILTSLRKKSHDVDREIEEIKTAVEDEHKYSLKESLKKRSTKIATLVGCGVIFFQNAGGWAVVLYYPNEIFTSAGSSLHPKHATIILGAIGLLTAIFSSSIIELFRRRVLLITSFLSTTIGLVILGSYYTLRDRNLASEEILSTLGFMPLLGLIIYILMSAIGVAPLVIVLRTELFTVEAKAIAMSSTGFIDWLLFFLMTRFYIDLKIAIGGDVTFYIFAGMSILGAIFSYVTVPETKNKTLEQIQVELNRK
ncbi:hypothetical protein FQR65_LT05745 [Abscondita terminalis]|nr:hypothetical protein FQR65_LT05745 [Abscondita terminalis]